MEEALIQIHDPELRKLLSPTTADLRFSDYLVRHVTENREDVFLDGTGWEGGDEWIRAQFAVYIHALLAATLQLGEGRAAARFFHNHGPALNRIGDPLSLEKNPLLLPHTEKL